MPSPGSGLSPEGFVVGERSQVVLLHEPRRQIGHEEPSYLQPLEPWVLSLRLAGWEKDQEWNGEVFCTR